MNNEHQYQGDKKIPLQQGQSLRRQTTTDEVGGNNREHGNGDESCHVSRRRYRKMQSAVDQQHPQQGRDPQSDEHRDLCAQYFICRIEHTNNNEGEQQEMHDSMLATSRKASRTVNIELPLVEMHAPIRHDNTLECVTFAITVYSPARVCDREMP